MKKYYLRRLLSGPSKFLKFLEKKKINYIKNKKIIWHITTPRSGSTSLMEYLRMQFNDLTPGPFQTFPWQENRFQNICHNTVFNNIFLRNCKFYFSAHSHTLASNDLINLISKNHIVIIQYRSIEDTIVSLYSYLKNVENFWIPHKSLKSEEQKITELIYSYVPWHINFIKGWILNKDNKFNKFIIEFNDIAHDFEKTKLNLDKIIFETLGVKLLKFNKDLAIYNSANKKKEKIKLTTANINLIHSIIKNNLTDDEINEIKNL